MRNLLIFMVFLAISPVAQAQTVKVYELYTSQNCPACPPANAMFAQTMGQQPSVVGLSCHVTYFDRPGREDPASNELCDQRQGRYAEVGAVDRTYTPMVFFDGKNGFNGASEEKISAVLAQQAVVPEIAVSVKGDKIFVTMPEIKLDRPADVWLVSYDGTYAVQGMTKLMSWMGDAKKAGFRVASGSSNGYAVIAEYANQGGVVAAGKN